MKKRRRSETKPTIPTKGWKAVRIDPQALGDTVEGGWSGIEVLDVKNHQKLEKLGPPETQIDSKKISKASKKRSKKKKRISKEKASNELPQDRELKEPLKEETENVGSNAWNELELHPLLLNAIRKQGFAFPLPIQSFCIPEAVKKRRDVLGAAQTGSGKTLAFGIPIFQRLLEEKTKIEQQPSHSASQTDEPIFDDRCIQGERYGKWLLKRMVLESASSEDLREIERDEEMEEILSDVSDSVVQRYEDSEEMQISDGELEKLHQNLGTVYFADLAKKKNPETCLKALILTPTRELALQGFRHLKAIGQHVGIRVIPVVGGMAPQKQMRLLKCKPHPSLKNGTKTMVLDSPEIVIATPGRFLDLYQKGVEHLRDLSQLRFLVVDECDKMIRHGDFKVKVFLMRSDGSFLQDLTVILQYIPEYQKTEVPFDVKNKKDKKHLNETEYRIPVEKRQMQTLLFSATLTLPRSLHQKLRAGKKAIPEEEDVDEMALALDCLRFRGEPAVVDLTEKAKLADRIQEAYLPCPEDKVDAYLYALIMKHPGRTLVFCNAIKNVRRLTECLRLLNISAHPIHAAKQQSQRLKALERFSEDPNAVLVATDVAARGLDLPNVRCVVHYNVPRAADLYIHRSGRTARVEADGLALTLVIPSELGRFNALFNTMGRKPPPPFPLNRGILQECEKRVKLAKRIRDIESKIKFDRKDAAWTEKAATHLDIITETVEYSNDVSNDRLLNSRSDKEEIVEQEELKDESEELRLELSRRLAKPLERNLPSKYLTGNVLPDVKGANEEDKKRSSSAFKEKLTKAQKWKALKKGTNAASDQTASQIRRDPVSRHQQKLKQILDKKFDKKRKMKSLSYTKQKLIVIPPALGREAQGPDALQVMRNYLKRKERSTN